MAEDIFNQADTNKDQRLDINEFRNLLSQNFGGSVGQYSASSFEASSAGGLNDAGVYAAGIGSASIADGGSTGANFSSYEQAAFSSAAGNATGGFDVNAVSSAEIGNAAAATASSSTFEASGAQQQTQQYAANAQGLFQDPNPQIIRRAAQTGQVTYTQNIKIRFLQPPPVPPPGPLIIKEVRPPQPPPPPPLVIRQRAPALPAPSPLILREKPPVAPAPVASQTIVRTLPPIPVPPRSVIIERLPALPPKPRDIIIERWIPYSAAAKRKTIIQRAEAAKAYQPPRNVIIQYEAPQVRVVRQFQRLGVTPENPQAYVQRYGTSLFDTQTLIQQARSAGVIEDISPPTNITVSTFSTEGGNIASGIGLAGGASSSTFETASFTGQQGGASFSGSESAQGGIGAIAAGSLGGFDSSSFASQAGITGIGVGGIAASSLGAFDSSSFASQGGIGGAGYQIYGGTTGGGIDLAAAVFNAADLNKDGRIDRNEFQQFINSGIQ